MLDAPTTPSAPWHDRGRLKRYARVKVLKTVIAEIERGCKQRGFKLPAPLKRS